MALKRSVGVGMEGEWLPATCAHLSYYQGGKTIDRNIFAAVPYIGRCGRMLAV